jgi:hypothetical protein
MSGWAANDKHPWNYGTTVMDISRDYLKLKMRLTPYMYTYCNEAYETGVPVVRGMVLEYPDDPVSWGKTTQYQFMSGEWMLVAPVYEAAYERDSIYLPEGAWIDYWDGTIYSGNQFLNDYEADLTKCPVFIKAGAIIPMYPEMLYDNELPKDPVTFDIYPNGYSDFELYEDDGISKEHREGAFAKTLVECQGPDYGVPGLVTINVGESVGDYQGKPEARGYWFEVHTTLHPDGILLDGNALTEYNTMEELEQAEQGWFYDPAVKQGLTYVKTGSLSLSNPFQVEIETVLGNKTTKDQPEIHLIPNPTRGKFTVSVQQVRILGVTVYDSAGKPVTDSLRIRLEGTNAVIDLSGLPEGIYQVQVRTEKGISLQKIALSK